MAHGFTWNENATNGQKKNHPCMAPMHKHWMHITFVSTHSLHMVLHIPLWRQYFSITLHLFCHFFAYSYFPTCGFFFFDFTLLVMWKKKPRVLQHLNGLSEKEEKKIKILHCHRWCVFTVHICEKWRSGKKQASHYHISSSTNKRVAHVWVCICRPSRHPHTQRADIEWIASAIHV